LYVNFDKAMNLAYALFVFCDSMRAFCRVVACRRLQRWYKKGWPLYKGRLIYLVEKENKEKEEAYRAGEQDRINAVEANIEKAKQEEEVLQNNNSSSSPTNDSRVGLEEPIIAATLESSTSNEGDVENDNSSPNNDIGVEDEQPIIITKTTDNLEERVSPRVSPRLKFDDAISLDQKINME